MIDVTIVNIALPSAQQALHFPAGDRQRVVTACALTFGSPLLSGGKLGDLFGRKRTFVAGLLGLAGASALGVKGADAGVASAMVNAAQQAGGSVGTSLLSAIFAAALPGYLASHSGAPGLPGDAAVQACTVGFSAAAVIFGTGLLVTLIVLPSRRAVQTSPEQFPAAPTALSPDHRTDRETTVRLVKGTFLAERRWVSRDGNR